MDVIMKEQKSLATNIVNFYMNLTEKVGQDRQTANHLKNRLRLLENYWEKFTSKHDALLAFDHENADLPYFKDDTYSTVEAEYISAQTRLQDRIEAIQPPQPPGNQPPQHIVHNFTAATPQLMLPSISLPTFSGNQSEWESFKQRFCSLIKDKANISRVEKLQHLLNAVQGHAAHRLRGLEVIETNFDVAWEKLLRRYDNPRIRLFSTFENLMQLPTIKARNIQDLNDLIDRTEESVRALRDLNCPVAQYDNWVVHCIVRKLDLSSREAWEASQANVEGFSTYESLITFLEKRIQTLEQAFSASEKIDASNKRSTRSTARNSNRIDANNTRTVDSSSSKPNPSCDLCKGCHWLHHCGQFNEKTPFQRLDLCKELKLCINCLRRGHFARKCPSANRCFKCRAVHHTKLHPYGEMSKGSTQSTAGDKATDNALDQVASHSSSVGASILLATAKIVITNSLGQSLTVRALIDPCAERCFITQRTVQHLNLETEKASLSVIGVGAGKTTHSSSIAQGILQSRVDSNFAMGFSALVLSQLTRCLPKEKFAKGHWPHLDGLELADPQCTEPTKIDCILGADVYPALILDSIVRGPVGTPLAQQSVFGWLLTGAITFTTPSNSTQPVRMYHTSTAMSLSQELVKFWEIEEYPRKTLLTPDEEFCEKHFSSTHTRDKNGRFIVRLPFVKRPIFVGSRDIAAACLRQSERRLQKDEKLAERYRAFMLTYLDLDHMEPVPPQQVENPSFYLPHHSVVKPDNPEKIRVVFNASQKARNGLSLNDLLLPGPKLQSDISTVVTLWRRYKYAFTTDVVQMFRQIKVHRDDADWQRILWRKDTSQLPQDYRCLTVTYGIASAPFLALRVMKQLAIDGFQEFPDAATVLQRQLYVDDLFVGADSIEVA